MHRKIGRGEILAARLGEGPSAHLRIPEDGLERYLSAHAVEPAGAL